MKEHIFLATTGKGLARAAGLPGGPYQVEMVLGNVDVRCLAADPQRREIVYAGTAADGVLRSADCGLTWQESGLPGRAIRALAASSVAPGAVYAGARDPLALYVSPDSGRTWSELESLRVQRRWFWRSPAEPPFTPYVQAIALSPTHPNIILAGIEAGAVLRSDDGGRSWRGHLRGALRDCHSLCFHSRDGGWLYEAGGTGNGAAVSRDAGLTWQQPRLGLDRHYGWACAADPARPEIWYLSASTAFSWPNFVPAAHIDGRANAHIYRSAGGAPWEKLRGGLPDPLAYMAYSLLTDPAAPGHLYAGLSNGDIWHTADHGDTWRRLPVNLGAIQRALIML